MKKSPSTSGRSRSFLAALLVFAVLVALQSAVSCRVPPPGRGATPQEDLYRQNCALCHGINGGGAQGPPLIDRPRSAEEVRAIVVAGRGEMPSFSDKLSEEQITAVAEYAAGLSQASSGR